MAALSSFKRIPAPLPLLLLLMLLLLQHLVVRGQNMEITQFPETILVAPGETITLLCKLSAANFPGVVRWYKGTDRNQDPIFSDYQRASNRGLRLFPGSNTDFSIKIENARPEDAGTYYCVKAINPQRELASGEGTLVSVITIPLKPVILGPTRRIMAGSRASFICSASGFSSQWTGVSWFKDGKIIPGSRGNILNLYENQSISYRVERTLEILLEQGDVRSQLTCYIIYPFFRGLLQQTFALGDILRVPPKLRLETNPPSPVQLNSSVTVTCNIESFYPDDVEVWLFPKDAEIQIAKFGMKTTNPDGTFSLKTYLEVMATEDRNLSMFLCQVALPDSQIVANLTTTLIITRTLKDLGGKSENSQQQSILVLYIAFSLTKVTILLFISCLFLIKVCGRRRTKFHSGTFQ